MIAIVNSRTSPGRELSPDPQVPHIGPRFPPPGRLDYLDLENRNTYKTNFKSYLY